MTRLTLEGLACPANVDRRPVCGVVVVAAAAGITFDAAWSMLARYYGPRWGGRTYDRHRDAVLRRLGVRTERVPIPRRRMTLQTVVSRHLRPGSRYIVRTTEHVQIVADGVLLDQSGARPVASCDWARRKLVKHVLRIIEA